MPVTSALRASPDGAPLEGSGRGPLRSWSSGVLTPHFLGTYRSPECLCWAPRLGHHPLAHWSWPWPGRSAADPDPDRTSLPAAQAKPIRVLPKGRTGRGPSGYRPLRPAPGQKLTLKLGAELPGQASGHPSPQPRGSLPGRPSPRPPRHSRQPGAGLAASPAPGVGARAEWAGGLPDPGPPGGEGSGIYRNRFWGHRGVPSSWVEKRGVLPELRGRKVTAELLEEADSSPQLQGPAPQPPEQPAARPEPQPQPEEEPGLEVLLPVSQAVPTPTELRPAASPSPTEVSSVCTQAGPRCPLSQLSTCL
ncbi:basic proline-rich protein-like [Pteropus medius]|uniref:basic proline-rich protein-like n=1 Tax=Pteropus vampyrus TaxID=132908 RepID=UPI00196BA8F5|nr:basic proline-rich protein-like [Pteropus giganteus]